jgi:Protein of unknown function (DUF4242)
MIERRLVDEADLTDDKVRFVEEVNAAEGVTWLTSFLTADKLTFYCLYEAPSTEAIIAAAERAGLPADVVVEVDRVYG